MIILSPEKDMLLVKWVVHVGSTISSGSILCSYKICGDEKVLRLKSDRNCGKILELLHQEGQKVTARSELLRIEVCLHTTIIKDLCADCGADLDQIDISSSSKASIPMIHSVPELKVSAELAKKLGRDDTNRLLKDRKLVLLVDLDQTLIHTTNDNVPNNLKDVYHFQLYGPNSPWYHTRLRPGTLEFLTNIDPLYELHICTFGARNYAHMICAFLDSNGRLFSHRILSRDECLNATSKKDNLKSLFPDDCGDSMCVIIDDRDDVWHFATNLIQVKPYHFFQHTGDINAPPGLQKNELDGKKGVDFNKIVKLHKVKKVVEKESDGAKAEKAEEKQPEDVAADSLNQTTDKIVDQKEDDRLQEEPENNLVEITDPIDSDDYLLYLESILKSIHLRFYEIYDQTKTIPDLKDLVPQLKSEVLKDVSIVFSGLVPNIVRLENSRPYQIAKALGARVSEAITGNTTHLVAASTGTTKVQQAQKNKKILIVTPDWLWACSERWEHVDEQLYPLNTNRSQKHGRQIPAHFSSSPIRGSDSEDIAFNNLSSNVYFQMSANDIVSMSSEVEGEVEDTSSDSDAELTSPPDAKRPRKRKLETEKDEEISDLRADFEADDMSESESGKSSRDENDDEDSPRAEENSSEFELDSDEQPGEEDEGEFSKMGAALERGLQE